ncbi:MAG: hypothetical protein JNK65_05560 [Deltaproteobacteria bacterium]|nr:hypothetical protein [Deltaproteobacteria bacterium]
MSTPNRLQSHWNSIQPLLLKQWNRLTPADLKFVDAEFDRLVVVIKQRYDDPVTTMKEADIRFAVLEMLSKIEEV